MPIQLVGRVLLEGAEHLTTNAERHCVADDGGDEEVGPRAPDNGFDVVAVVPRQLRQGARRAQGLDQEQRHRGGVVEGDGGRDPFGQLEDARAQGADGPRADVVEERPDCARQVSLRACGFWGRLVA